MKMRDHKIGGSQLPVEWSRGEHDSRQTGDQELEQERDAEKHGRFELNLASHRFNQVKILIPVGIPTIMVVIVKKLFPYELIPTVNMW